MTDFQIVGIKGRAGSGKSTAARHLVEEHGYVRVAFAAPLRRLLAGLGLNEEELNGSLKEKPCAKLAGQTPRAAMQVIGSALRALDPDFFVKLHERAAREIEEPVVVDDCRYPNEAAYVRRFGGPVIEVIAPSQRTEIGGVAGHESEKMNFDPDIIVRNDMGPGFFANLNEALDVLSADDYAEAA